MTNLPQRLLELMRELDLEKPKDLADFCGVSEGLVSQWFSGRTRLGPKPLRAFAGKTNFSLDWVTEGKLPKYRSALSVEHMRPKSEAQGAMENGPELDGKMHEWLRLREHLGSDDVAEFTALIQARQERNVRLIEELENTLHPRKRSTTAQVSTLASDEVGKKQTSHSS